MGPWPGKELGLVASVLPHRVAELLLGFPVCCGHQAMSPGWEWLQEALCKPSTWASSAFEQQSGLSRNMRGFFQEGEGLQQWGFVSQQLSRHLPHAVPPSHALLSPYLKASSTFLPAKHLQLPHRRRSSQRGIIASRGPDVNRRQAPSPAWCRVLFLLCKQDFCTAKKGWIVESQT